MVLDAEERDPTPFFRTAGVQYALMEIGLARRRMSQLARRGAWEVRTSNRSRSCSANASSPRS